MPKLKHKMAAKTCPATNQPTHKMATQEQDTGLYKMAAQEPEHTAKALPLKMAPTYETGSKTPSSRKGSGRKNGAPKPLTQEHLPTLGPLRHRDQTQVSRGEGGEPPASPHRWLNVLGRNWMGLHTPASPCQRETSAAKPPSAPAGPPTASDPSPHAAARLGRSRQHPARHCTPSRRRGPRA